MNRTNREYRDLFDNLPPSVQERARKAFKLFEKNPNDPYLSKHPLDDTAHNPPSSFSVRIDRQYRAVAFTDPEGSNIWYWIGIHHDYDRKFKRGRRH